MIKYNVTFITEKSGMIHYKESKKLKTRKLNKNING